MATRRRVDEAAALRRDTAESDRPRPGSERRRGRRERNPEETKRRILDAAENEFARKGYDGARLRDVALAAGVHHALLHHYYGDKEGLFRAVVERAFSQVSSRAFAHLRMTKDTPDLLRRFVATLVDFHAEHPNLVRLLYFASLDEGSPAYDACQEITQTLAEPLLDAMRKTVARAQEAGVIRRDLDARRLVTLAMGATAYVFHEDAFFSAFLGEDVRTEASVAAHKDAAFCFLARAVLTDPDAAFAAGDHDVP